MDIILTVIPPPLDWDSLKIERKAFEISNILKILGLKKINIPEVIDEKTRGDRVIPYREKIDNVYFGELIRYWNYKIELMIDKVVPHLLPWELDEFVEKVKNKISYLVLVGGESSKIQYPGLNPLEATLRVKGKISHVFGITIFHREKEEERLLKKTAAGMEGFVSQIIFDFDNARRVIQNYLELCENNSLAPGWIYISLSPLSRRKDYDFIKWLGVVVNEKLEKYLLEDEKLIEKRSLELIEELVLKIKESGFKKIGINVEHVMYNNIQVAAYAIHRIKELLWNY